MPSPKIEVLTSGLAELPVVQAWTGLGAGHPAPDRVEILSRKVKSVVHRLVGVGAQGSDVIAKSCRRDVAAVERRIYDSILPRLPLAPLVYYASVDDSDTDSCWLFLEDAGGERFDPSNMAHRELATRWLAGLHTGTSALSLASELPDRGPGYYLGEMLAAARTMRENRGNPALSAGDREILDLLLGQFDFLESRWGDVEHAFVDLPRSVVHNDFAERNVRIRAAGQLAAFDWEVAGWGLPPVDLAHADVGLYGSLVREAWPALDAETLRRLAVLGKLLRGGLAATNWCVGSLATGWVCNTMLTLRIYHRRIDDALRALEWIA